MAIIYTSRNVPGGIGGDYTNGAWGSLMNNYSVRFTGPNSGPGSAYVGITHYFSGSVYFPWSGNYTVRAAADNSGQLTVDGRTCPVAGFGGSATQVFYSSQGWTSLVGWVYNAPSSNDFSPNPYGIAFTIDAPSRPPAPTVSISRSPGTIIQGQCSTLTWSSSGVNITYRNMSNISSAASGSTQVCPTSTTTYFFDVRGEGGNTIRYATVTVYVPPVLYINLTQSYIIAGACATINWYTTGDASNVTWTSGNISNGNVTSTEQVCPATTTTYSAYATGLGGTSPSASVTLTVYQLPVIEEFEVPLTLNYGEQGIITYKVKYANISVKIQKIYEFNTYDSDQGETSYTTSGSAELNGPNATVEETNLSTGITYNNFGPRFVNYILTIQGGGGSVSQSKRVEIIIDESPDNVNIDETDGLFKDEEPVYTPNIAPDDVVESDLYLIDGIDIPVEITASLPILVDVNQSGQWSDVRVNGSSPPQGSSTSEPLKNNEHLDNLIETSEEEIQVSSNTTDLVSTNIDEDFGTIAKQATASFGSSSTIIKGQGASFSWNLTGGYTSASISGYGSLTSSGSAVTYSVQNIPRWFSTSPAPGDHMCSPSNPGGYAQEGTLFKSFTTQAPGTFFGYDAEAPGVKPTANIGYVYPFSSSGHPVGTTTIYEKIDPNGGPPNGFGTIWTTSSSGEGPYTANGPNTGFKAPTSGYTDYSGLVFSGSATVYPTSTTTYTLSASGSTTGSYSASVTITVLIPPIFYISVNVPAIVAGGVAQLSWYYTGDANSITWTSGGISNGNLSSSQPVSPETTTTYCAYVNGPAGASPVACAVLEVYQIPTIDSFEVPLTLNYDEQGSISFTVSYANVSVTIQKIYEYNTYDSDQGETSYTTSSTALLGGTGATVEENDIDTNITYDDFGPRFVNYILTATGQGGTAVSSKRIEIVIDEEPDNINIDETDGLFKDQEPVYTPNIAPNDIVQSDLYLIEDIDIPVEIKSSLPILIDVNQSGEWKKLRQTGSPPPAGSDE